MIIEYISGTKNDESTLRCCLTLVYTIVIETSHRISDRQYQISDQHLNHQARIPQPIPIPHLPSPTPWPIQSIMYNLSIPWDHHAIFIEISSTTPEGVIFQVTGNIQQGMSFETRVGGFDFYHTRKYLGQVDKQDYEKVKEICMSVNPPSKQFEGARRIDPKIPLRRCGEWTLEAIETLKGAGVLKTDEVRSWFRRGKFEWPLIDAWNTKYNPLTSCLIPQPIILLLAIPINSKLT